MKLSVIIPIYQGEKTILRCIKSVELSLDKLSQRYKVDGEIILINDGSTDNTAITCKVLSKKYQNIIYIEQKHLGVSTARNNGLKKALGDFISFVDADDAVSESFFSDLYREMKSDTALVISNPVLITNSEDNQKPEIEKDSKLNVIDTPWTAMDNLLVKRKMSAVWGKLFRKKFIENLFIERLTELEDMCFLADYLSVCKGVVKVIPKRGYQFYLKEKRELSIEKLEMIKVAFNHVSEVMKDAGCAYADEVKHNYINYYMKYYSNLPREILESDLGKAKLQQLRDETRQMFKETHLKVVNMILYLGLMANPEIIGNFVSVGDKC